MKTLSIVIPAYNEEKTIKNVLDQIIKLNHNNFIKEVIVVNDGSKDKTANIISQISKKAPFIKLITNEQNLGKTGSVVKGILQSKGDYIGIQDADLECLPEDLVKIFNLLVENPLIDVGYGNRFNKLNKSLGVNHLGNRFLTGISNLFTIRYNFQVKDMEVCYKVAKAPLYKEVARTIQSTRFGFEPEVTAKFAQKRAKVINVDIRFYPRYTGKKLNPFTDGPKAVWEIVKYNFLQNIKSHEKAIKPKANINNHS